MLNRYSQYSILLHKIPTVVRLSYALPWVLLGKSHTKIWKRLKHAMLMDVPSDLADTFPNGQYAQYYRAEWLTQLIKDTKTNRDFQGRTIETARWAREQVKRQMATSQGA